MGMKKIMYKFSGLMIAALVAIGTIGATPTCWFLHYQPEVPETLRK